MSISRVMLPQQFPQRGTKKPGQSSGSLIATQALGGQTEVQLVARVELTYDAALFANQLTGSHLCPVRHAGGE